MGNKNALRLPVVSLSAEDLTLGYLMRRNILASLLNDLWKKRRNPCPIIHIEIKNHLQVPSYFMIPEKEFPQVLEFLADWWRRAAPDRPVPQIYSARQDRVL